MSKDTPKERAEEYFKEKKGITPDQAFNSKAKYSSIDMVRFAESFAKQEVERALKEQKRNKTYVESDLQRCELCERYADIELMHSSEDCYICQICHDLNN